MSGGHVSECGTPAHGMGDHEMTSSATAGTVDVTIDGEIRTVKATPGQFTVLMESALDDVDETVRGTVIDAIEMVRKLTGAGDREIAMQAIAAGYVIAAALTDDQVKTAITSTRRALGVTKAWKSRA